VILIGVSLLVAEAVVLGVAIGACTALPLLAGIVRSASLARDLPRG